MISSFGTLLEKQYGEQLGEGGKEYLDYITDANKRMGILLQKLLQYVKVGTIESPITDVPLEDMVLIASSNLRTDIERTGAVISTSGSLPEVKAHRDYILHMFEHLFDNAIKYNQSEKPTVEVFIEEKDGEKVIAVRDNGIGISPDHQQKVFELFLRLHSRSEYPGSGIGLSTCEKIAQFYGGRAWVESKPGNGTTVFISIPSLK